MKPAKKKKSKIPTAPPRKGEKRPIEGYGVAIGWDENGNEIRQYFEPQPIRELPPRPKEKDAGPSKRRKAS